MWIGTNKNVAFHVFFLKPAKTMAVLSSSCTILDPNFCCFHEERHGTRRFCVAPSNSLEIFGETIITKEWKMGQCSTKKTW